MIAATDTWTAQELLEEAARRLEATEDQPFNITARTLRFYREQGLLGNPERRGRKKALYAERHLHQLCLVKRLQLSDWELGHIANVIAGIGDRDDLLRELAGAPLSRDVLANLERAGGEHSALNAAEVTGGAVRPITPFPAPHAYRLGRGIYLLIDDEDAPELDAGALKDVIERAERHLSRRTGARPRHGGADSTEGGSNKATHMPRDGENQDGDNED